MNINLRNRIRNRYCKCIRNYNCGKEDYLQIVILNLPYFFIKKSHLSRNVFSQSPKLLILRITLKFYFCIIITRG